MTDTSTLMTGDPPDHDDVPRDLKIGLAEQVRRQHERLKPHLEFIARLAGQLDDHDEDVLRSTLLAALNCTDDDLLPYLQWCAGRLYPAADPQAGALTQLMVIHHRATDELRNDLRDLAVGDLDSTPNREAVRQRLYELRVLVLMVLKQQIEVVLPRVSSSDRHAHGF